MHQDYMVRVPGGTFRMGNTPAMHLTFDAQAVSSARPRHRPLQSSASG